MPNLLLALTSAALAVDTDTFDGSGSAFDRRMGLQLDAASLGNPGAGYAGLTLVYAHAPVEKLYLDGERELLVAESFGTHLAGGYTFGKTLRLDLAVPFYPYVGADAAGVSGGAVGDAHLSALIPVVRAAKVDFALKPGVVLPIGTPARFTASGGFGAGLTAALEARPVEKLFVLANAGIGYVPKDAIGDVDVGSGLTAGLGAGYRASERVTVGAELDGVVDISDGVGLYNSNPFELHAYGSYALPVGLVATLGAGTGLVAGIGAPEARVVLGLAYVAPGTPPVVDRDGDGLLDDVDACVDTPETLNGWKDTDGCPDSLGTVVVSVTRDGAPVSGAEVTVEGPNAPAGPFGLTSPREIAGVMPESAWKAHAELGACLAGDATATATEGRTDLRVELRPELDATVEVEVVDGKDAPVPTAAVTWEHRDDGCAPAGPMALTNGKGSQPIGVGKHRIVVNADGYAPFVATVDIVAGEHEKVRAVLQATKVRLEKTRIVILDKVYFETAKAVIKPESFGLLNQVADVLLANPSIERIEVAGHTDSDGKDSANLTLSQARAESVVAYLVGRGVDAARLTGKGYGETKPIDSNKTKAGKANNRRVEFTILDTPAGGTP